MMLTPQQLNYLKSWAYEEMHNLHGPAHELQTAHGVKSVQLTALFRVWTEQNKMDLVGVTRILNRPPCGRIAWPWKTADEFLDCYQAMTQITQFWEPQAVA